MKISIINGSQKTGESNTGHILEKLKVLLNQTYEINIFNCGLRQLTDEMLNKIISTDVIILVFPLFVHSLPSNTLKMLIELENTIKRQQKNDLIIYTIINNGFYEGKQNNIAFDIIKNWCDHTGVMFGGGIGQGAGEMISRTKHLPKDRDLFKALNCALQIMAENINTKKPMEIQYLSPNFPKFLWRLMAVRNWNNLAKNNGLSKKDILKRL
ncbi:MAG: NAD(P)H-dependent oxidoreductase [Treponema sp.]|jgi:multimeric flavodoxin WrbA|nr:NAD(P)H-dependent oxidoreductase [Treponema sp.]